MSDNLSNKVDKLKAIQKIFIESLPQKINIITDNWTQYKLTLNQSENQNKNDYLENCQRQIHNIAGSAGSLGCAELGANAKELELSIIEFKKSDNTEEAIGLIENKIQAFIETAEKM